MKKITENTGHKSKGQVRRNAKSGRFFQADAHQPMPFNGANHTATNHINKQINGQTDSIIESTPKTALGRELMKIRQKIVDSGEPLLSWDEVNREVARRRGEIE